MRGRRSRRTSRSVARPTSRFVCQGCGEAFLRWEGQCRNCGAWNSLVETVVRDTPRAARAGAGAGRSTGPRPIALSDIGESDLPRLATAIGELDRVLGGGLVPGSLVLVGGEPGIGKSTLLLQAAAGLGQPVLYATGEESAAQVRIRAAGSACSMPRPAPRSRSSPSTTSGGSSRSAGRCARRSSSSTRSRPPTVDELDGAAGSVGQVREATVRLMEFAKGEGIAVVLVGHVTKDGSIAGPKTMEHLVDAVVSSRASATPPCAWSGPPRTASARRTRSASSRWPAAASSRYPIPARAFLAEHPEPAPGSVVAPTMEGSRPLLVEVQALVAPAGYGTPARKASGIDPEPARAAGRGARPASGHRSRFARCLRQPRRRPDGRGARTRPAAGPRPRVVPARPAARGPERGDRGGRAARRAALGDGARTAPARSGPAGLRSRASCPRPGRGGRTVEAPGLRVIEVATLRDAVEAALDRTTRDPMARRSRRC